MHCRIAGAAAFVQPLPQRQRGHRLALGASLTPWDWSVARWSSEDELEMTATEPGNAGSLPIEADFE